MRVGHPPRGLDLGGDISPLGAWGDELPGQVRQNHCCGVGAGDSDTLRFQGRDDLASPGGVPPAPAGFEPGASPCLAHALQLYWSGPGGDRPGAASYARPRPLDGAGVSHWPRIRPPV